MIRFLVGLLVGVVLGGGGAYAVFGRDKEAPSKVAHAASADAGPSDQGGKRKKRPRGARATGSNGYLAGGGGEEESDEPIPSLTAADLAGGAEGDALKPRPRDVDLSNGAAEVRDLEQSEIDGTFRQVAANVTDCITAARGAAPVRGRISVGVLVDPDGKVAKSRVEAPAWLLRHGLYRCVRREVASLRFPAVGKDTVVTVPFDLE